MSNSAVKSILKKRGFFDDIRMISEILKPIKDAILTLERTNTTLADCYLQILKIATFFKEMPTVDYRIIKNECIKIFNKRYEY